MLGWMRASKLRLPDSTAAHTRSFCVIVSSIDGSSGPAVADARRAAIAGEIEVELFELLEQVAPA